jgi:hypothetical protein
VPPMHKASSPSESSQPAPAPGRRTSVWRRISPASSEGAGHDDPPFDSPVNMAEPSADASLGGNRRRRRRPRRRQHPKPQSPDPEQLEVCGNGKDASPRPASDDGSFPAMPHPCVLDWSDRVSWA